MNRPLIITIGIVVILLVFGVWVFLFMFGAPKSTHDVFSDLGIVDTVERPEDNSPESATDENIILSLSNEQLQQLTTTPIAGFGIATSGTKTIIRYVERGTGHIFEVDISSGIQTQISNTTMPKTTDAIFSPELSVVVFVTEENGRKVILGEIPKNSKTELQRSLLTPDAKNISFQNETEVYYTRTNTEQTIGYVYNIRNQEETQEFLINIPDMSVVRDIDNVYVYTKPTEYLEGFLYSIENSTLAPIGEGAYGLTPLIHNNIFVLNYIDKEERKFKTTMRNQTTGETTQLPSILLPEKCVFESSGEVAWCAKAFGEESSDYLESWYKGILTSNDEIWRVDITTASAELRTTPLEEIGRPVDVTHMTLSPDEEYLVFINKIDSTLWLYKI